MNNKFFTVCYDNNQVYRLVYEGDDYVIGYFHRTADSFRNIVVYKTDQINWCENPDQIKVGDSVRLRGYCVWRTVLYIHQAPGDDRRWVVYAYEGDIPCTSLESELEKKID